MTPRTALLFALALVFAHQALCTVYFSEEFNDGDAWTSRWVHSTKKGDSAGAFAIGAGEYATGTDAEKGLECTQDMKHYTTSATFPEFSNKDKTLVFQFQAKLAKKFDCGGAYLKLYPKGLDQENMDGDSEYNIMFGPDHCGYSTKKIHAIFNYGGKNHEKTDEVKLEYNEKDEFSHVYTLIVKPDNTFEILFDGKSKSSGSLTDHWAFLKPKEIDDPADSKPSDWVDEAMIDDADDVKPDGYDDIPKKIVDASATMPEEWDTETDGDWEAPMIDNPEYKGEWKAKRISNPAYKGEWKAKRIPNPDFVDDAAIYAYDSIAAVGLEVWQVNGGTIFDNIIVTDDLAEAEALRTKTFDGLTEKEKKIKEEADKLEREAKEAEEKAAKAKKEAESDDDDDDDDEDEKKEKKDEL